jgi:hypothetical protein
MFELDGLSVREGRAALPCALRAWQRWYLPVILSWI